LKRGMDHKSIRQRIEPYILAVGAVAVATLIRWPLWSMFRVSVPYMPYFLAIVVSALVAGWGGGLLSVALSVIGATCIRISGAPSFSIHSVSDLMTLSLFTISCMGIAAISHQQGKARRLAEDASTDVRLRQQDLAKSEERYKRLLQDANEGMIRIDQKETIAFANPSICALLGYESEELVGQSTYILIFPEDVPALKIRRDARRTGVPEQYEARLRRKDGEEVWAVANVTVIQEDGLYHGTFTMFTDITYRKQAEFELAEAYKREVMLNRISEAIRQSMDIDDVQQIAVKSLGEALGVDRCVSIVADNEREVLTFVHEWKRSNLPSLIGEYRTSIFKANLAQVFPHGKTLVINDIRTIGAPESTLALLDGMKCRSLIGVPLSEEGEVVAILGVFTADAPRSWSDDEVSLVQAAASQLRSAVDASRLLAESESRAERAALINRIGQALRASLDPVVIQHRVAELLGSELKVDRCYYITYDISRDSAYIATEWRRDDLEPLAGAYRYEDLRPIIDELFATGTAVVNDVHDTLTPAVASHLAGLDERALIGVPLYDKDEPVAALFAAMADGPRKWTSDELAVAEHVALLTRSSVESARVQEREHRIASRLQDALQPAIPDHVPGLKLAQFYHPGLEEAEVGGDFADCFSVDKGLTYLIVGDLSGKGLAAAAQVAIVRNMLRFALYNDPDLAQSINTLNRTLADNNMIAGFATLFVGRYDGCERTLRYVNCAQEPGLVRRAAGQMEMLPPTGSVLGTLSEAVFAEQEISLDLGDCLAIFTDGLTEAGPIRSQLLGITGVSDIFKSIPDVSNPTKVVSTMVEKVNIFAQGGVRDDVCVLVAVVTAS